MISRRSFLGRSALAALAGVLARWPSGPRPSLAAADETLGEDELATLDAFAEVLVPTSFGTAVSGPVVRKIVRDLVADGDPTLPDAMALLDDRAQEEAGARFARLDLERRRGVVDKILGPYASRTLFSNPYYYLTATGRRTRLLWWRVAKPVLIEFYRSPLGWRLVDYQRRPGECSNLTDYQFALDTTGDARPGG
jgi:hypothetical protein